MERARATWTDERLDDLARRMDQGFARIDADLRALNIELSARIDAQGARIDALQRTMLQVGGGIIASIFVAVISLIATGG